MKRIFLLWILMMTIMVVHGIPAKRNVWKTLTLEDGTEVLAQLVGDEHGHFWLADDGKAYLINKDGIAQVVDANEIIKKATPRRQQVNDQRAMRLKGKFRVGAVGNFTGTKKALILLVNYSDTKFADDHNQALFNRIANEKGFNEGNFKGSMADYFRDQSRGMFELDFDIVGPLNLSKEQSYYGGNDKGGDDLHAGEMVCEAVELAKEQVSDWTVYDWNNDKYVDQVYVIYAGKGEADGGGSNTIWPHAWSLSSANNYGDGTGAVTVGTDLKVDSYACGSELNYKGDICGIGTMCHEFSHCLGYPDFYDIDYSGGQGMGDYDLMDAGSYNGNGYQPAGYTSYERWMAGWLEPIELDSKDVAVTNMKSLQNGGESYIIYNKGNRNEYMMLENRQLEGWDASLPHNGLLILHCDYDAKVWSKNGPNDDPDHQRMTIVPADGNYPYKIKNNKKYYDPAVLFPYYEVTAFNKDFKTYDTVAEKAAQFYTKNTNDTYWIDASVENITQNSDNTISFNYVYDTEPILLGDVDSNGQINMTDVILIIDHILGNNNNSDNFNEEAADMNNDGYITVTDAVLVIEKF